MSAADARLRGLRTWFVVGLVVQLVVGTVVAVQVTEMLGRSAYGGYRIDAGPRELVVVSSLLAGIGLLALALLVFHGLLQHRNWARLVMLVLAWLSVAGAVTSFLSAPLLGVTGGWIARALPGVDLGWLAGASLLSNALKLVVWGYVIAVLQFDHEVRAAFPAAVAGT
jgi:hypothetical protein